MIFFCPEKERPMQLIKGDIVYSSQDARLMERKNSYLGFENGRITGIYDSLPEGEHEVLDRTGCLVIPGLSDLHLHAPQYQYAGLYMDEELLEWLEKHTFPEESKYKDVGYAEKAYGIFVDDLAKSETTRFAVFGTIHRKSTLLLMKKLSASGLKGFVGKVNMDRNSPEYLIEKTDDSIDETKVWLDEAASIDGVGPIITPRFIPSCSNWLLERLGVLATERGLPVQSHLDENPSEVEWVKSLCPWSRSYSDAYDRFSLFGTTPTIMAHAVWPDDDEIALMGKRKVFVAHSPSSNANLSSGIAPVRRFLDNGIPVGLATDVAGGSTLSMFRMMTSAIEQSKLRWRYVDSSLRPLTFAEAFHLATRMGGSFFGNVGAFEPGFEADILVIDPSMLHTTLYGDLSPAERLEAYCYRKPGEGLMDKFVAGRRIF